MPEPKLYKKFRVIRVSTGIEETEEYCSLRLSKEINIHYLIGELGRFEDSEPKITWKDIELILLKSEIDGE